MTKADFQNLKFKGLEAHLMSLFEPCKRTEEEYHQTLGRICEVISVMRDRENEQYTIVPHRFIDKIISEYFKEKVKLSKIKGALATLKAID